MSAGSLLPFLPSCCSPPCQKASITEGGALLCVSATRPHQQSVTAAPGVRSVVASTTLAYAYRTPSSSALRQLDRHNQLTPLPVESICRAPMLPHHERNHPHCSVQTHPASHHVTLARPRRCGSALTVQYSCRPPKHLFSTLMFPRRHDKFELSSTVGANVRMSSCKGALTDHEGGTASQNHDVWFQCGAFLGSCTHTAQPCPPGWRNTNSNAICCSPDL